MQKFGSKEAALELVEEDHSLVRFYLPPECKWDKIRGLTTNVGQHLTEIIRGISKANPTLQGVIDIVDFNATISGQRIVEDARLPAGFMAWRPRPHGWDGPKDLGLEFHGA